MKKILKNIVLLLSASLLFSCNSEGGAGDEKLGDEFEMKAEIVAIGEKITVNVVESDVAFGEYWVITADATEYLGKDRCKIKKTDLNVGDTVVIAYGGQVMMSLPPQIVAARISVV